MDCRHAAEFSVSAESAHENHAFAQTGGCGGIYSYFSGIARAIAAGESSGTDSLSISAQLQGRPGAAAELCASAAEKFAGRLRVSQCHVVRRNHLSGASRNQYGLVPGRE